MASLNKKNAIARKIRSYSNSWVMLHEREGFVLLTHERIIYTSPPRTGLSLQSNSQSSSEPVSIQSGTGCVHLTNQRIVYLPQQQTPQFESFSAPLLNLHDTHVSAPFFGPNVWTAMVQPVAGGGIPPSNVVVQLKLTFKDGGAFDFHSNFERIKERLQQAVEQAREYGDSSQTRNSRTRALDDINLSSVHLDELPAYEGPPGASYPGSSPISPAMTQDREPTSPFEGGDRKESHASDEGRLEGAHETPTEPPPGYEEAQQQSIVEDLESRLRLSR
ncbi:hypothetical protein FQN54_001063 [Arachnomyces sp. PD_36]|nr:hypothetical protein FQN54_001063 [Arachnomyces sp. PD_36]